MSEPGNAEAIESFPEQVKVEDILDGKHVFHWANVKYIKSILARGLYSPAYAQKIRDSEYKVNHTHDFNRSIYLTRDVEDVWPEIQDALGLVIELPKSRLVYDDKYWARARVRIPPKYFRGLVIYDRESKYKAGSFAREQLQENVDRLVDEVVREESGLPIYGLDGNLVWPRGMSHEEIVQMLSKQKSNDPIHQTEEVK